MSVLCECVVCECVCCALRIACCVLRLFYASRALYVLYVFVLTRCDCVCSAPSVHIVRAY